MLATGIGPAMAASFTRSMEEALHWLGQSRIGASPEALCMRETNGALSAEPDCRIF